MLALPPPRFTPCERCGASVERDVADGHVCERERLVEYALFQMRDRIVSFDEDLGAWLDTPQGRFESFYASYRRLTAG